MNGREQITPARTSACFGVTMDKRDTLDEAGCALSPNSSSELELRLSSMQSLVCELLKVNQELREALSKTQSESHVSHGPHTRAQRMETA